MVTSLMSESSAFRCGRICLAVITSGLMFSAVFNFRNIQIPNFRLDSRQARTCLRPPSLFTSFTSNLQPPLRWRREVGKPEVVKPEVVKPEVGKPGVGKPEITTPGMIKEEISEPEIETSYNVMEAITSCAEQHLVFLSRLHRPSQRTSEAIRKVVPNVIHYVLIGVARNLSLYEYLSFLSVEKFQKPDQIFVHGNMTPGGPWWNRTIQEVPNIYHVWTNPPSEVFSRKLTRVEHIADVMRYAIIYDYGGIYLDSDVLLLKSLDPLRTHPLTLGRVDGSRTEIANGIIIGRSGTDFLRLWALTYATYSAQSNYDYHSVRVPAMLERLYPYLVHVEKDSLIRPHPLHQDDLLRRHYNWSTQFTCHIWHRRRGALTYIPTNLTQMEKTDTALGEIMRHVYHSPG